MARMRKCRLRESRESIEVWSLELLWDLVIGIWIFPLSSSLASSLALLAGFRYLARPYESRSR
jgi:hypothetical protein